MSTKKNAAPKKAKIETQTPGALSTIKPESISVAAIPPSIGRFDGLQLILADNITLADWRAVGVGFGQVHAGSGWALGDWLNGGERFAADGTATKAYKEAIEATGIDYGRLRTFASIAKRFPADQRRRGLSFEHHRLLAPVKKAEAVVALMDRVQNEKLSASALRNIVPKSGTKRKKLTDEQKKVAEARTDEAWREKAQGLKTYLEDMPKPCMPLWRKLCEELGEACQGLTGRFENWQANAAADAEADAAKE